MAIICRDHNLLFVMSPRTGCTAIGELLQKQLGGEWLPEDDILDASGHYAMSRKHNTLEEIMQHGLLTSRERKKLFVFSAIRNPFDSLVSLYVKKATVCHEYAKDPDEYVHKMPRYLEDMQYCATHSFDEWIQHRFDVPWWRKFSRRKPRTLYTRFATGCDAVMRFESLGEDFCDAIRQAGIAEDFEIPLVNVTPNRGQDYRSYYSDQSQKIVQRAFAVELNRFGYRF